MRRMWNWRFLGQTRTCHFPMIENFYKRAGDKQRYPEWVSALFLALLVAAIGAGLGFVLFARHMPLAMNDIASMDKVIAQAAESQKINPAASYYVRPAPARPTDWQGVQAQFSRGSGTVTVSAADINGWLQSLISRNIASDAPTFGFHTRQVAVANQFQNPIQWQIAGDAFVFGKNQSIILIIESEIQSIPHGNWLPIQQMRINAAPIPAVPGLRKWIANSLLKSLRMHEGFSSIQTASRNATAVEVIPNQNALSFRFPVDVQ